jgi:hypothetical protein
MRIAHGVSVLVAALLLVPATAAVAQDEATPIGGEASTDDRRNDEERAPQVVVTDVRVGSHEGFDRVVFEIGGEGQAGWFIQYDDDPRSDGSGEAVDVAGDAALRVVLTNIAMPHAEDAPEGVTQWEGDVEGPPGGVITEVVDDLMFEGNHTFFVGLDQERPYRVERLSNPQRVVIDIVTAPNGDEVADEDVATRDDTPVGGVETGLGGSADTSGAAAIVTAIGLLALAAGGALLVRRRS